MESARILRIEEHNHAVIPPIIGDLKLDLSRVKRLYIEGGNRVCGCKGGCAIFRGLRPKVVILESTTLDIAPIGGLASSAEIEHLVIKFRPLNGARYPEVELKSSSLLRHVRKVTIVFTSPSYVNRNGQAVEDSWIPKSLSVCAKSDWGGPPSFGDMLRHIKVCCQGVPEVIIVGVEKLDERWVRADLSDEKAQPDGEEWINDAMRGMMGDLPVDNILDKDDRKIGLTISFRSLPEWRAGSEGRLLDAPPISAGFKGKGMGRRPMLIHKAVTV